MLIAIIGCGGSSSTTQSDESNTIKTSTVTFSANFDNDGINAAFLSDIAQIKVNYYTMCNIVLPLDYGYYGYDNIESIEILPYIAWKDYYDENGGYFYYEPDCMDNGTVILDKSQPTATITTFPGYAKFDVEYTKSDNTTVDYVNTAGYLTTGNNNVVINSLRGTWTLSNPVNFKLVNDTNRLGGYAFPFKNTTKLHIFGNNEYYSIYPASFDNKTPAEYNWNSAFAELTLDNGTTALGSLYLDYITQFKGGDSNENAVNSYGSEIGFFDNATSTYVSAGIDILGVDPIDTTSLTPLTYVTGDQMNGVVAEYIAKVESFTCKISLDNGTTWIDVDNSSCLEYNYYDWISNASIKSASNKDSLKISAITIDGCDNTTSTWTDKYHRELCYDNISNTISWPDYTYSEPTCSSGNFYYWDTTIYSATITESIEYCTYPFTATRGEFNIPDNVSILE